MTDINERALGWDEEISKEGPEFILLPAGDYDFEVSSFERGRFDGSEKMSACNKAILNIKIETDEGVAVIVHNLFLHQKTEGFLSEFFMAIGQKKKGQPLKMDWNTVVGTKGRCKVGIRNWTSKDGNPMQSNEIKKFYEPKQPVQATFTPGAF